MTTAPHRPISFIGQFFRVIAATLLPLVLLTFVWLPMTLGGHPGEARSSISTPDLRHMS